MKYPLQVESATEEATRDFGRLFARELRAGDVVSLSGSLGSGKTVFVRGLAEGLGVDPKEVVSPTFALVHEYECRGGPPLVHLDLYRIDDERKELFELGLPDLLAGKIAAVEWPNAAAEALLPIRFRVYLTPHGIESRTIRVEAAGPDR